MASEGGGAKVQLGRKASTELYLGMDPGTGANNVPFRNLHSKVHFKTIE